LSLTWWSLQTSGLELYYRWSAHINYFVEPKLHVMPDKMTGK